MHMYIDMSSIYMDMDIPNPSPYLSPISIPIPILPVSIPTTSMSPFNPYSYLFQILSL